MELATVLDQNAFLEELTDFKMQKVDFLDDPRSTVSIRNLRNGMGLIDMQVISDEISVSRELLHNKIRNIYPRSLFAEEISLLRGTLTTTFENTIGRQLEIRSPLDASELVIGIRKESRKRRIILTFSDRMLESFIQNVYGDPVNMDEFIKISGPPEPFAKIDLWIIDKLKNSDSGFLHYQQWVKLAIEDGVKVGSVMMYLSSSPYLRSLGHGVTSLVGHSYSEVEVKNYRDLILNSSDKTEVQLVFEDEDIFVHLRPSLSNFASGVVIIKREIADIVRGRTFSIHCKCQSLHSTSNLELNSTSFWTGFNPILTHGREVHYLKVSQLFRIQLDFEQNTATLII
jgi:hypothetical protein